MALHGLQPASLQHAGQQGRWGAQALQYLRGGEGGEGSRVSESQNAQAGEQDRKKRPASQYYWGDWWKDKGLHSCSLTARGLWHEMNCLMHDGEPYGHLTLNGRPMTVAQLANQCRISASQCTKLLRELEDAGVPSRTPEGVIFSRRMVRDEASRNARAEGGKLGAEHGAKGAEHGAKGGRPAGLKGGSETPLDGGGKPPPSSSSSTSVDTPIPPEGGKRSGAVSLKTWTEAVKAKGEKPIPESDPVFVYADEVGIPPDFLRLAWQEFRHRYSQPESKRYRDWRAVFRKAVRGNWLKLWFLSPDGSYSLTTVGHQAMRAHDDRKAA
jgi:hypothetical protein